MLKHYFMKFLEVLQTFGIIHIFLTERLLYKLFRLLSLLVCFALGELLPHTYTQKDNFFSAHSRYFLS